MIRLKNAKKASKILGIPALGMMPKMILDPGNVNLPFIQKRLIAIITQNILQYFGSQPDVKSPKTSSIQHAKYGRQDGYSREYCQNIKARR
jgi:hypothetical protein